MDERCDNIKNIDEYCGYAFYDIVWGDWIFITNFVIAYRYIMASP